MRRLEYKMRPTWNYHSFDVFFFSLSAFFLCLFFKSQLLFTFSSTPLNKLQSSRLDELVRALLSAKPTGDPLLKNNHPARETGACLQGQFHHKRNLPHLRQLDEQSFITPADFLLSTNCWYQDENCESKELDPSETSQLDEAADMGVHQRDSIWMTCLMRRHDN